MISINHLIKTYPNGFKLEITELNFDVNKIHVIVGPNGSGKTTFIHLIFKLITPDFGEVNIKNLKRMNLLASSPVLFRGNVMDNFLIVLKSNKIQHKEWLPRINKVLSYVNMDENYLKRNVYELSSGEKQRVALARLLLLEPEIVLLDEPTRHMDNNSTIVFESAIKNIIKNERPKIIIITTHDLTQAYRIADEIYLIIDGKMTKSAPENLYEGEIKSDEKETFIEIKPKFKIYYPTEKNGKVRIQIDPKDIVISKMEIHSSARNTFQGKVFSIMPTTDTGFVNIVVEIDGIYIVSKITQLSLKELNLIPNDEVFVTFKTSSVKLY